MSVLSVADIVERLRQGQSLAAIGRDYGRSKQRIHQVVVAAGYVVRELQPEQPPKPAPPPRARCASCGKVLRFPAKERASYCSAPSCEQLQRREKYRSDPAERERAARSARRYFWRRRFGTEPPAELLLPREQQYCGNPDCRAPLARYLLTRPLRFCMKPACRNARYLATYGRRACDPAILAARQERARQAAERRRLQAEEAIARRGLWARRARAQAEERALVAAKYGPLVRQYQAGQLPISQRELARRMGIPRSTLQGILSGKRRPYLQEAA